MDYESLDYNRSRWNRMLLGGFWLILLLSILLESMYLTITEVPHDEFIRNYMLRPTILLLLVLLLAELGLRTLKNGFQDYILIVTSTSLAFVIVFVHNSVNYLLLALFLPVMVSIFYFHPRKLLFAYANTLLSVYVMYGTNPVMNNAITNVGLTTITVILSAFTLIAWGIIMRGRELVNHLTSVFASNRELLVKTVWMDKLAKTDALTELYNHITFHEYFERLIEQNERNGLSLQLALVDIDSFKQVNDMFGHRAGDAVLRQVAELIRSRTSANDFAARYGGEEFAVLFTDKSFAEALAAIETIRQEIAALPQESLRGRPVTVSVGFAEYKTGEGKELFFNTVDEALYKAKSSGKNKTVVAAAEDRESQLA